MASTGAPQGIQSLLVYLTVADVDATCDFYQRAFGFEITAKSTDPTTGVSFHAEILHQGVMFMIGLSGDFSGGGDPPALSKNPPPMNMYIYSADVDALTKKAVSAGAVLKAPPAYMFWGDRCSMVVDIDGHCWVLATHQGA